MRRLRRQLLRTGSSASQAHHSTRLLARRKKLEQEQQRLGRWWGRLRRALHAVERHQQRIARREREIARFQQG